MKILLRAYNPDQPRDDGGKWTAGAYSSGGKYSGNRERIASAKDLDDNIHFEFPSRFEEVFGGRYSVKYKNAKNAINKHSSHTSALDDKSVRKAMDRAFKYAGIELQQDAMVYRGVNLPPEKVAEMLKSVDTKGRVYLQQNKNRYVPTTRQHIANAFGNVQLKIFLPKGTRVLPIAEINGFEDEREVTLNRGARFRVVGGRTLKSGKKEFTLEYVGAVHNKKSQLGKLMGLLLSKISPDRRDHFGSDIEYIEIDDEVVHGEKEEGDFVELGIGEAADVDMEDDEEEEKEEKEKKAKPKPEWCMECDDEGVWHVRDTAEKGDRVHDYERAGYKKKKHCGKCGSTKNLIVHHKDHNHNNNRKGNHETICRTCHSKEHADQKRGKDGKYGSGTNKSFTAPSSATGGLQGYDLEGNRASRRAGVRLRPKRRHLAVSGTTGRAKIIPQGAKQ